MADLPADWIAEAAALRQDLHAHPEVLFDLPRTAGIVASALRDWGCDQVVEGVGHSGVVGVINGTNSGPTIGLRADMDALPMTEATQLPYASQVAGRMHACGHDGHTAMLLLAARKLAHSRDFAGTAVLVFQPAEENGGAGARAMLRDGLIERFGLERIFGLHVMPDLPTGMFATRSAGIMAAADSLRITVTGKGGHAGRPETCIDPLLVCSHIHVALQSILSRNIEPTQAGVVSVTMIQASDNEDTIAPQASMRGTVRTLDEDVRDLIEARLKTMVPAIAQGFGAAAEVAYLRDYPVTWNDPKTTELFAKAVAKVTTTTTDTPPRMISEDFGFYGAAVPASFGFLGMGDGPGLHDPKFDFDDRLLPLGARVWLSVMSGNT
ncbi:amidohydrolase [Aliishimia ponticola]|uniref:Amidohydrolase n=1 Tax=Aliishimia ponticola TaxID=2499833 RepID=A0A4S4NSD6_9RHOB|nr:amidohydrolase [Aliishimia ponticola]THH39150.1 amidohydrolase [Aliishimia ponticola]